MGFASFVYRGEANMVVKCPRCDHSAVKNGMRPIRKKGAVGRRQGYLCTNPKCWYQWEKK